MESRWSKSNLMIDYKKQNQEKNINYRDYPLIDLSNNQPIKQRLGEVFDSWQEYLKYNPQRSMI